MIDKKVCKICKELKSLIEYYHQNRTKANGTVYTYYHPNCKKCTIEKTMVNNYNNYEKHKEGVSKYENKKEIRIKRRKYLKNKNREYRNSGKRKEWENKNRDKIKQYNEYRSMNKKHKITKREWEACKEYFNNSCAYCGLSQKEHFNLFKGEMKLTDLHKEHVVHNGENDLSNCVPACKVCNSSKHDKKLEDWYNINNDYYSQERYVKIYKWIEDDYKLIQ